MNNNINGEPHRPGRIEVICGSMFSGKTEELIRRLRRAKFAKQKVEIFKPAIDVRYSEEDVVSHDQNHILSTPIDSSASILLLSSDIDVVGIDEAQFFDMGLPDVCNELANRGIRVIIAGLDMDFRGVPFGPMPSLCAIADDVTKVHAICVKCGSLAYVSHRTVADDRRVLLGETHEYAEHSRIQVIPCDGVPGAERRASLAVPANRSLHDLREEAQEERHPAQVPIGHHRFSIHVDEVGYGHQRVERYSDGYADAQRLERNLNAEKAQEERGAFPED